MPGRAGFFWKSAANTGSFCVLCFSLSFFLLSFVATLFLFLRNGRKETDAFEVDWLHQRQRTLLIPQSA